MRRPADPFPRVLTVVTLAALTFGAQTPAQDVVSQGARPGPGVIAAAPASLSEEDGQLLALGRGYQARFDADGVEFVPALGHRAWRTFPVGLRFAGASRGPNWEAGLPPTRRHEAKRVEYARGVCVERYDVTLPGIEQSFLFETLPPGDGDLVVRMQLTTGLRITPTAGDIQLDLPGIGGLRISGVSGVDALGERVSGSMRVDDDILELSLPAAFVAHAALPLLLDPLIGSVFTVGNDAAIERQADVAYDMAWDTYMVVWETVFSATRTDIVGQRVGGNGALILGRIPIASGFGDAGPSVANVRQRRWFVVTWNRNGDVIGRGVPPGTGTQSSTITVAGSSDVEDQCDVGGDATPDTDEAICVWRNGTTSRIEAARITVSAANVLSVHDQTAVAVSAAQPPSQPRLAKSGGPAGHQLLVYSRRVSASNSDVIGVILTRSLSRRDTEIPIAAIPASEHSPDVDGDGRNWLVAWTRIVGDSTEIHCAAVSWDPNATVFDQGLLPSGSVLVAQTDVADPGVVCTGSTALVTFARGNGLSTTFVTPLDLFSCRPCESLTAIQLNGAMVADAHVRGCSQLSGGGPEDHALLALQTGANGANGGDIQAHLWTSADGLLTAQPGGCGTGADAAYATCARAGNGAFRLRLTHARGDSPTVLVVSRDTLDMPCGACRLVPDPYTGLVYSTATSPTGRADLGAAIPATPTVVGLTVLAQWVVATPVAPGCYLFGADLSPTLRITIQ